MSNKVLFILTSTNKFGNGHPTGAYLGEFLEPYLVLKQHYDITLASPRGGEVPLDPGGVDAFKKSNPEEYKQWESDSSLNSVIKNVKKLSDVVSDVENGTYKAIFYPGGHGPVFDLPENKDNQTILQYAFKNDLPTGAVCHGPAVFLKTTIDGKPIVANRKMTGFTDSEEAAVGLTDAVPFLLQHTAQEQGAKFSQADNWAAHVVTDGKFVTGQNPASAKGTGEALLKVLQA